MTDIDLEEFSKESSINNEDYWFLKLNQVKELPEEAKPSGNSETNKEQ